MRLRSLHLALLPLCFAACLSGTEPVTYPNIPIESTTFDPSLGVNLAASTKTASGLYIRDITVGTGKTAAAGDSVFVYYGGAFPSGFVFDQRASPATPFPFILGTKYVIPGWDEGLVGMKVGGVRQLVIPPALAYGSTGYLSIPPNAVLVFKITLANAK
jgi:FKBP-type peptidyl-prolyl cis-trans isomerase